MSLFTPSGGLVYHARALRYRNRLWAPFRRELALWLESRLPAGPELVLVGPSGGHCLPLEYLARFRRLIVLDPDPVARRLLSMRLPSMPIEFEHRDLLWEPLLSGRAGLDTVLGRRRDATVLFCNLLGQVQLDQSDEDQHQFQAEFRRRLLPALAHHPWASFHDHWSLEREAAEPPRGKLSFAQRPSDEELGQAYFGPSGAAVTVFEHGASALFPEAWPRSYFSWQLTPNACHIVEGVVGPSESQVGSAS